MVLVMLLSILSSYHNKSCSQSKLEWRNEREFTKRIEKEEISLKRTFIVMEQLKVKTERVIIYLKRIEDVLLFALVWNLKIIAMW